MHYFELLEPDTIIDACRLLKKYGEKASLLAGGTDLIVKIKQKKIQPDYLINLKKINNLDQIIFDKKKGLTIGALATLADIESNNIIREKYHLLSIAANSVAAQQIRNRATIGGNSCNAAPSADTVPALIALNTKIKILGLQKERIIPLQDFFLGPGLINLSKGEILKEFIIPLPGIYAKDFFVKHCFRKALDLAIVSIAVHLEFDSHFTKINIANVVMGAVAPTPMRAIKAENALLGKNLKEMKDGELVEIANIASSEAKPITDIRSTAEYRREMIYQILLTGLKKIRKSI